MKNLKVFATLVLILSLSVFIFSGELEEKLFQAVKDGNLEVVKELVSKGADVNAKDEWDLTPLQKAAEGGHLEIVKYLVENGADVNDGDNTNETPLWYACSKGHLDVVKYLVSKGAVWSEAVKGSGFPVSQAAKNGHLDVVKYFVEELGFDVNSRDKEDMTLLHWGGFSE